MRGRRRCRGFPRVVRPFVHDLVRGLDRQRGHRRGARRHAALGRQRQPRRSSSSSATQKVNLPGWPSVERSSWPGMPPRTLSNDAGARCGRWSRWRGCALAERVVGGVHAERAADRAVDDDERRAAAGARGAAVQCELGLAHRLDDRDHDRQVLGQAAGHHRGDRDFLRGDAAAAHRLDADHVGRLEARGGKKARDGVFGRRDDRQAVGPAVALESSLASSASATSYTLLAKFGGLLMTGPFAAHD